VSAHSVVVLHTVLAVVWLVLALATTGWALYDPESRYLLAWVIFMSAYANAAAHLAGRAGAGPSEDEGDDERPSE
jgi:hypothetical protein